MRIFLLHFYLKHTNPVYSILADELRARGHEVWLGGPDERFDLIWHDGKKAVAELSGPKATSSVSPDWSRADGRRFMLRLRSWFAAQKPDIVQINPAGLPDVWLLPLGFANKPRFVVDWRQIDWPTAERQSIKWRVKHGWRVRYVRHLFDRATFLHAAGAQRFLGPAWQRWASVVPLGVDEQFLNAPAPGPLPNRQAVQFVYIGSLSRVRRLEVLLEAAAKLRQRTADFQLRLIGPDNAGGHYHRLVDKMELGDVISIQPPVAYNRIPQALQDADVALAYVPEEPADWQYHPTLKVLEYRALGLPILATDVAPNRSEVVPGANGLLIDNDPGAWSQAMSRFVEQRNFLSHCRNQAAQMRRGASWASVAATYEEAVYEPLLGLSQRKHVVFPDRSLPAPIQLDKETLQ